jgi:hypothetical protein
MAVAKAFRGDSMSSTEIQLVFEGSAVQSGMIDAQLFAESLAGYSEIFRRANNFANGDASEAAVLVESNFKAGSFIAGLQLEQHVIETAAKLITEHQFLTAGGLAMLIGFIKKGEAWGESLIDLWKWLKGKKPDGVTQVGNSTEITVGTNKKIVSNTVYHLYGDSAIRAAFGRVTEPLRQEGFNRISVRQDGKEQVAFEKDEASYFQPEPLQLESNSTPTEGERDPCSLFRKLPSRKEVLGHFLSEARRSLRKLRIRSFGREFTNMPSSSARETC